MISASAGPSSLVDRAATAFAAYREGDPTGMSGLVDEVTPVLWHTARACGLDTAAAEDVVQTTWLRLVEQGDRIVEPRAVLKWLVTTARREAWDVAKKARRTDVTDTIETLVEAAGDAPAMRPDLAVLTGETERALWEHIQRLPHRCQALLRVIAFADKPDYASIAEALGMSRGSIGPTRGRCLAKLRVALMSDPTWEVSP